MQEFVHSVVGSELRNLMVAGNAGDVGKRDAGGNMYTVWWTEQKVNGGTKMPGMDIYTVNGELLKSYWG